MKRSLRALATVLVLALCAPGVASATRVVKHHHHKVHHNRAVPCAKQWDPLPCIAEKHGWDAYQQQDWWLVLARESGSTPGHWNLTAANGSCYGMAQFIGGPTEYYALGGNPYSAYGQLTAMANYIVKHGYGTPAAAWYSEETRGFY